MHVNTQAAQKGHWFKLGMYVSCLFLDQKSIMCRMAKSRYLICHPKRSGISLGRQCELHKI